MKTHPGRARVNDICRWYRVCMPIVTWSVLLALVALAQEVLDFALNTLPEVSGVPEPA